MTRLGENSRMVITGDITQIDLPRSKKSGLKDAMQILRGIKGIEFFTFSMSSLGDYSTNMLSPSHFELL